MKSKARFKKVSLLQFMTDCKEYKPNDITGTYDKIKLPKRSTSKSAGYDFYIPKDVYIRPNESIMIPTGIRCMDMAEDEVLMMYPRSGLGSKYRFVPANLVGIIDADYAYSDNEGHIFMKMVNDGKESIRITAGQAFCQGIITKFCTTIDDDVTTIRNGGFGSTNK